MVMNKLVAIACIVLLGIKPMIVLSDPRYRIDYHINIVEVVMKPNSTYKINDTVMVYYTVGTYFENGTLMYGIEFHASYTQLLC